MIGVADRDPHVRWSGLAERGAWFGSIMFFAGTVVGVPVGVLALGVGWAPAVGVVCLALAAVWWVASETPPIVERVETAVLERRVYRSAAMMSDDELAAEVARRLASPSFRAAADRAGRRAA